MGYKIGIAIVTGLFALSCLAAFLGWGLPGTAQTRLSSVRYGSTGHRGYYGSYGGGTSFGK